MMHKQAHKNWIHKVQNQLLKLNATRCMMLGKQPLIVCYNASIPYIILELYQFHASFGYLSVKCHVKQTEKLHGTFMKHYM
jgi:hypothetical protein